MREQFQLFAEPWWVNLLILVPLGAYYFWRRKGLALSREQLTFTALFGIGFGIVEAAVVVYLRIATGLIYASPEEILSLLHVFPVHLFLIELLREIATISMLVAVAFLGAHALKERFALFLWAFAFWDIVYYVALWGMIGWPQSLTTPDILFLIPVPWLAQIWFPILVSTGTLCAVILSLRKR